MTKFNALKTLAVSSLFMLAACGSTNVQTEVASQPTQTVAKTTAATTELSDAARAALATKVFYFSFDSTELSQESRSTLVYHAVNLKGNTDLKIRLEGHASEEGTREYNMALGERRAKAIANFLMANGVSGTQIETVSYGEEKPAVSGSTEEARSKNRRVEIK